MPTEALVKVLKFNRNDSETFYSMRDRPPQVTEVTRIGIVPLEQKKTDPVQP